MKLITALLTALLFSLSVTSNVNATYLDGRYSDSSTYEYSGEYSSRKSRYSSSDYCKKDPVIYSVPESSTMVMLLTGLIGLFLSKRRK